MTRAEMHKAVSKLLYIEDYGMIDVTLASMVANKLKLGDPVWLLLIGASSGGKSQLLRPIALSDPDNTVRVDDLTENTLISGMNTKETSLLLQLGGRDAKEHDGTIMVSDLTVLFSKSTESRNAILSQLRMVYDGEMTKYFGNQKPVTWRGHAGIIAGSTPSVYRHFAQVADMGERFIYYRMKEPDYVKANDFIINNAIPSRELDSKLSDIYSKYLKTVLRVCPTDKQLTTRTKKIIQDIALAGTRFRTPVHVDDRLKVVDEIPTREAPYRVTKQLNNLARALHAMHYVDTKEDELPDDLVAILKWCAYSLASDKRRSMYESVVYMEHKTLHNVSAYTGLHPDICARDLAELTAIGVIRLLETQTRETRRWVSNDILLEVLATEMAVKRDVEEEDEEQEEDEVF
jgi:hypothetical protein